MRQMEFNAYDIACMRKWGISAAEDTRTQRELDSRLVVPEWLRRAMWRQFWADQDALFEAAEPTGVGQ